MCWGEDPEDYKDVYHEGVVNLFGACEIDDKGGKEEYTIGKVFLEQTSKTYRGTSLLQNVQKTSLEFVKRASYSIKYRKPQIKLLVNGLKQLAEAAIIKLSH